jgi:hypothetical protein
MLAIDEVAGSVEQAYLGLALALHEQLDEQHAGLQLLVAHACFVGTGLFVGTDAPSSTLNGWSSKCYGCA